jgi:hypothetical protein
MLPTRTDATNFLQARDIDQANRTVDAARDLLKKRYDPSTADDDMLAFVQNFGFNDVDEAFTPEYVGRDVAMEDLRSMPHTADLVAGETEFPETSPINILNRPKPWYKNDPSKTPSENKTARAAFDAKQIEEERQLRSFISTIQSARTVSAAEVGQEASHPDELLKELTYSSPGPDGTVVEHKTYMTLPEHTDLLKAYGILPEPPTTNFNKTPAQARVQYTEKKYNSALLRANPDVLFVFDDNLLGTGKSGQAIIRNEPNAIGVPTKRVASRTKNSYFGTPENIEEEKAAIDAAFDKIRAAVTSGKRVYFPSEGLGAGTAQLAKRSPELYAYVNYQIDDLMHAQPQPTEVNALNLSATMDEDPNVRTPVTEQTDPGKFGSWLDDKDLAHEEETPFDTYMRKMWDPDLGRYVHVAVPTREAVRERSERVFQERLAASTPIIETTELRDETGTRVTDKSGNAIKVEAPKKSRFGDRPETRPIGSEPVWSVIPKNEDAGSARKNKSWQRDVRTFGGTEVVDAFYLYDPKLVESTHIPVPYRGGTRGELVRKDVREHIRNGRIVDLDANLDQSQTQAFQFVALTPAGLAVNKFLGKNASDAAVPLSETLIRNGVPEQDAYKISASLIQNRTLPGLINTLISAQYRPKSALASSSPADEARIDNAISTETPPQFQIRKPRNLPLRAIVDAINAVSSKAGGEMLGTTALFSLKSPDGEPIIGGYGANIDYTLPLQFTAGHGFKAGGNIQPNNRLYFRLRPGAIEGIPTAAPQAPKNPSNTGEPQSGNIVGALKK